MMIQQATVFLLLRPFQIFFQKQFHQKNDKLLCQYNDQQEL